MSSSRSIAAARSRHIEQPPKPPTQAAQRSNTFASDIQTRISVQDAINIVTRRITRIEQMTLTQQLQVPDNSCIVDNNVLEDIISRLDKLETTQEKTLELFRREFNSNIEILSREINEKLVDIDLAFTEIEKSIQIEQETETITDSITDNGETISDDITETIKLEISNA